VKHCVETFGRVVVINNNLPQSGKNSCRPSWWCFGRRGVHERGEIAHLVSVSPRLTGEYLCLGERCDRCDQSERRDRPEDIARQVRRALSGEGAKDEKTKKVTKTKKKEKKTKKKMEPDE